MRVSADARPGFGIQTQAARYAAATNQWGTPVELSAVAQIARNPDLKFDAAFRAVAEEPDAPLDSLRHHVLATAREYQKLGKPETRREFGRFYGLASRITSEAPKV